MNFMSAARLIFILQYSFKNACCIECYQCRSDRNEGCNEAPIDDAYLKRCPPNGSDIWSFCRKIHQILYFTVNEDEAYVRECGYVAMAPDDACVLSRFPTTAHQTTCQCFTDGCNRSRRAAQPAFAAAAAAAAAAVTIALTI